MWKHSKLDQIFINGRSESNGHWGYYPTLLQFSQVCHFVPFCTQSSVLGPFLFLIMISDINKGPPNKIY